MLATVVVFALLSLVLGEDGSRIPKRSIGGLGIHSSWNSILGHPWMLDGYSWHQNAVSQEPPHPFSEHPEKEHMSLAFPTSEDIAAAMVAAKEATAAAALARQRVQAAKEQLLIQERKAAAKEAAARAAIQKSEALAATVQKSGVSVAGGHLSSVPWSHSKPVFNHWI